MSGQFSLTFVLMAVVVAIMVFHAVVCLFVFVNPQAAAAEVAKPDRSFLAWIYLTALQMGRNDAEMDLVQQGLSSQAVTNNCKRRAVMGLGSAVLAIVLIAYMSAQFWRVH